jgi:hypothetical protein
MIRRTLLLAILLTATAAHASWWPSFSNNYVSLETRQFTNVSVRAQWSGLTDYGFVPWKFRSSDDTVAIVEGGLDRLGESGNVKITAVGPGTAQIFLVGGGGPYATIVVTEDRTPMSIAATSATVGKSVTLTAINPPPMATVFWYVGHLSDFSREIGTGTEVTFTPATAGVTHVWAYAVSPTGITMMELPIDVRAVRSRSVRH